ncbi:MAG: cache domain-containing protein [Planctomycetes bacterium]|nr:cache domain-containing protein [Planctomycetota bacterium]
MILKSKIFRRFLIVYLPVTLAPLIIISCITLWYGRIEIRDQTFRQLQIIADGAEAQVLDYLNYLKIQTSGYSASKPIIDALKKRYCHTDGNHSDRVLNRYLAASLKNFPECVEMFVLDVNGGVIASSDASNTGKDLSETDYFLNGRKAVYVGDIFREEETGRITWLVSCPVMDAGGNKLLAVLVCRINPATLSDITTERKIRALGAKSQALRIGKTSETYIVNRDNLMITESQFLDNVILKQAVDTEIVRRTRKVSETKAANYSDYRGVPVDGASMIIWETGWIIQTVKFPRMSWVRLCT